MEHSFPSKTVISIIIVVIVIVNEVLQALDLCICFFWCFYSNNTFLVKRFDLKSQLPFKLNDSSSQIYPDIASCDFIFRVGNRIILVNNFSDNVSKRFKFTYKR